ncbi:MAG: VOC family protein [Chloroflexota bacterium]
MLKGISEIILYVQDMNAQVTFYRDILKLPIAYPPGLDNYSEEFWVVFDTGVCKLALHGGGKKRFGDDAPKFVFDTGDVSSTRQYLIDHGVTVGKIRSPAPGVTVCDAVDPEGNYFSIECR